jgi:colicin import membrane protein
MAYLLMTAGIMALGLFLASRLANACGFLVKGRALALAGLLACGIAVVLPILAPFLTRDYYWKLGLLVLIAALLVTAYNARLVKKDLAAAEQAAAETPASATPPEQTPEQMPEAARQAEEQAGEARPDIPTPPVQPAAAANKESDSAAPALDAPSPPQEEAASTADTAHQAPQTEAPTVPIAPAAFTKEDSRPPRDAAPPPPPGTEEHASARHAPAAQMPEGHTPETAAQASEKHAPEKRLTEDQAPEAPWAKDIAALTTLDAFLDYAYAAQQRGDIPRALAAYREALKRYSGDPYVPYLFIDLGNLCKQQARYADCIEVYRRGLRLPIIAENEAMAEEFRKNIRYLRIVYHILEKHQALTTPFGSIPQTYRAEIETAYQAAQAQHHGS